MGKISGWAVALAQNLLANAIWYAGAAIGAAVVVIVAKLTPALKAFAPFSYLAAGLFVILSLLSIFYVALRIWDRFRGNQTLPPAHDESGLAYQVAVAEGDIRTLRPMIEGANAAFKALEERQRVGFAKIDERLSELDAFLRPMRRQRRKEVAEQVVRALRFFATPTDHDPHALPHRTTFKGTNHPLVDHLRELGYTENDQVAQDAEQEIRGREEYRTLYANEQPQWENVAAKLNFHVAKARLEALANHIAQKEGL